MIVTRDEILDAIDRIASGASRGLCSAFEDAGFNRPNPVPFIVATGGKEWRDPSFSNSHTGYFWPDNTKRGRNQRLMFLAFMLTWHDDITGYKD